MHILAPKMWFFFCFGLVYQFFLGLHPEKGSFLYFLLCLQEKYDVSKFTWIKKHHRSSSFITYHPFVFLFSFWHPFLSFFVQSLPCITFFLSIISLIILSFSGARTSSSISHSLLVVVLVGSSKSQSQKNWNRASKKHRRSRCLPSSNHQVATTKGQVSTSNNQ